MWKQFFTLSIIIDGFENASVKFSAKDILKKTTKKRFKFF